jgi:hypothetical protein
MGDDCPRCRSLEAVERALPPTIPIAVTAELAMRSSDSLADFSADHLPRRLQEETWESTPGNFLFSLALRLSAGSTCVPCMQRSQR